MFLINWGEIKGRIDPFYYKLEYRLLEKAVLKNTQYRLRDFIVHMAGGATPSKEEKEKYYTDASGIPFVRVQNLTPEGLNLSDCTFINDQTHNNMLSRSKVKEDDLLVKITGVGRMAVSSVAPKFFEGNINQHMVVIKTKDRQTSELIAAYLNSDIGEKLAYRRTTGGTRPALDYTALRSIPIIINSHIVEIMELAYEEKKKKVQESEDLLKSINDYILNALGTYLSNKETYGLSDRIFYTKSSDLFGQRLDPAFYFKADEFRQCLMQSKYPVVNFNDIITSVSNGVEIRNYQTSGYRYLRVSDMSANGIVDDNIRFVEADGIPAKIRLSSNDIIISRSGSLGLANVVTDEILDAILSSHIFKVSIMPNINVNYLQEYLRSTLGQIQFFRNNNGGIIPEINQNALKKIKIVLPSKEIQDEIAQFSINTRNKANELLDEADKIISNAKQEVENILMGDKQ